MKRKQDFNYKQSDYEESISKEFECETEKGAACACYENLNREREFYEETLDGYHLAECHFDVSGCNKHFTLVYYSEHNPKRRLVIKEAFTVKAPISPCGDDSFAVWRKFASLTNPERKRK